MNARLERSAMLLAVASLVIAASCAPKVSTGSPRTSTAAATQASTGPRIERLDPDSARIRGGRNVEVTIRGSGFAAGEPGTNTIEFGGMKINAVAANAAGTEIRFTVPQRLILGGGAPPVPVQAGSYDVRVTTLAGASNAAVLRVLP